MKKTFAPDCWDPPDGPPYFTKNWSPCCQLDPSEVPPYYTQKNEYPLLAGTHLGGRLTCGPTKLTGTEGFVNLVNTPVTVRCPSNGRSASSTSGLRAPAAQSSAGRAACTCLPWLVVIPRRPHHPLLLPPLARPCLYSPTPLLFYGDGSLTPQPNQ